MLVRRVVLPKAKMVELYLIGIEAILGVVSSIRGLTPCLHRALSATKDTYLIHKWYSQIHKECTAALFLS